MNGLMYVWGGREVAVGFYESLNNEEYGNQMYVFDPVTCHWSIVIATGDLPIGRRSHSAGKY